MQQRGFSVDVYRLCNIQTAKLAALIIAFCIIFYHGIIHIIYGSNSCHWLLSDGNFHGHTKWQPYGCMMHTYSKGDLHTCTKYIDFWGGTPLVAFVGDSRIRQLYFSMVGSVSSEPVESFKAHSDLQFRDDANRVQLEFLWQPVVNGSMMEAFKKYSSQPVNKRPGLIVLGSATWTIKNMNASPEALASYAYNLSQLVPYLNELKDSTRILWMVQDPVNEKTMWESRAMITNNQVDQYNAAALKQLEGSAVHIWSSSRLIAQEFTEESDDGLHLSQDALNLDVQVLWNLLCNEHLNLRDGQCCTRTEPVTNVQKLTAAFFTACAVLAVLNHVFKRNCSPRHRTHSTSLSPSHDVENPGTTNSTNLHRANQTSSTGNTSTEQGSGSPHHQEATTERLVEKKEEVQGFQQGVTALARLGVIMFYFYMCDRRNFLMKENKHYSHINFILPFLYFMILGIFFNEKSKQTTVLHRDQTDEWKGWMQLIILIYHYTGASQVLPIYMQIRVLVSSYLFMSGFGHFCFFWNKGDYSPYRFCMVMFRMNFLVVTLCFVMNRPYQFYYFVPLVSFWFIIVYVTMAIWPHVSAASVKANSIHYIYLVAKFGLLIAAIAVFYASEMLFERVFLTHPFQALFVTSDGTTHEWFFRWQLDRFSTLYGMLFAFVFLWAQRVKLYDDSGTSNLFSLPVSLVTGLLALMGFLGYTLFASVCGSKQECNKVHSYIAFLPILSFIILRNLPGFLRARYSSFFAWFGRISLELFIGQYHIWLAADTYGLLVFIPNFPVINTILTSFVFVCAAHEIHTITGILAPLLVPNDWKLLLRNMLVFVIVLLPLAISHGAFGV